MASVPFKSLQRITIFANIWFSTHLTRTFLFLPFFLLLHLLVIFIKGLKRAKGANTNPLYAVPAIPEPLINEKANLNKVVVADTYLYDLPTKAGQEYILTGK